MRRSLLTTAALFVSLAIAGCSPSRAPAVAPRPAPPRAPAPLGIDPLPGSVAELEALADDTADAERGDRALEKLAAILHAESALVHAPHASLDAAAAKALRRLLARARLPGHEGSRGRIDAIESALLATLSGDVDVDEADALLRHRACPSRFPYTPNLDGAPVHIDPLPQDHGAAYWNEWERIHPVALDQVTKTRGARPKRFVAAEGGPPTFDADTHYVALYAGCTEEPAEPAAAERHAEAWLAVARAHRPWDSHGGPYFGRDTPFAVPRAIEAYQHAIVAAAGARDRGGRVMLSARLELGDALHTHERYHAAAEELVRGLTLCEDTGGCTAVEQERTLLLLADSLAHVDYEGPPADAPDMDRPDIIDLVPNVAVAARKLAVAVDRAVDPALVPPERAFAPRVLAALAQTFHDLALYDDEILAFARLRERFPAHPELPRVLEAVARAEVLASQSVRHPLAMRLRAVGAWDDLVALVAPDSPWTRANSQNADALADGRKRANEAALEVANTLASLVAALGAAAREDGPLPIEATAALASFRRAALAWTPLAAAGAPGAHARAVLAEIATAELAWLAHTHATIDPSRWTDAWSTVVRTRDDPDSMDRRVVATRQLIDLADLHLKVEEARFAESHGKLGLAPREHALHAPLHARPLEPLPSVVEDAVRERETLVQLTSSNRGFPAADLLTEEAGLLFAYGHTTEASARLAAAVKLVCKRDDGFSTWVLAAQVARAGNDKMELARLGALHADRETTCAKSPAEIARGRALTSR